MPCLLFVGSSPGVLATVAVVAGLRCSVEIAPSIQEALDRADETRPNLVVIEARSPDFELIYLIEALKTLHPGCPLIVTAGEPPTSLIRELTGLSIDILFGKPVPMIQLLERIMGRMGLERLRLSRHPAKAVQYIAEQYAQAITLPTIAAAVGVSASHLADQFRKDLGMPVKEYLRKARIEVVKHLLRSTDGKIEAIAVQAGFSDASHLSRLFQEYAGMRPGLYRRFSVRPAPLKGARSIC